MFRGVTTGFATALAWACAATAWAQVYQYTDENGVTVLTNIKADYATRPDARRIGCYGTCIQGVDWNTTPLKRGAFGAELQAALAEHAVDEALVRAIMHAESFYRPDAESYAGAQGLMQLMPAIQQRYGVADPFDPAANIAGGVAYLADLLARYDGDWRLAAAAYNAGEGAVDRHGGVPPFDETREYLRRVDILRRRYSDG